MKKVISALILAVIAAGLIIGIAYLTQPAITAHNAGYWWILFFAVIIVTLSLGLWLFINDYTMVPFVVGWIVAGVIILFITVVAIIGSPLCASDTYMNLATINDGSFEQDFSPITSEYRFMDKETAAMLGDRVLGNVDNSPWYEVDSQYSLIVYQGKAYRISPLKYGGLIKYNKAHEQGIPGYVLVNIETGIATFTESSPIYYSPSAYFGENLTRHLRRIYRDKVFESTHFEIDDQGTPYWITPVSVAKAGLWGAREITEYIVTNATTGECKLYSVSDSAPEWIDQIYPVDYAMQRAGWKLSLIHGAWNSVIGQTDVLKTTYSYKTAATKEEPAFYGYTYFVGKDGHIKMYTGITPPNRTESNKGFLVIDCVTGSVSRYNIAGAEESSAQKKVEDIALNYGFQSTFPYMVNVNGSPTYILALKGKSGLIQRYAFVDYQNYADAYIGETFEDAFNGFTKGTQNILFTEDDVATIDGIISEKYEAIIDGNTFFYYIIDQELYRASITVNEVQVTFKVGDTVTVEYVEDSTYRHVQKIFKN